MIPSEPTSTASKNTPSPASDSDFTMEMLELELALDGFSGSAGQFPDHVRTVVETIDGVFLFDLPASGLIPDCSRIAVLRIPTDGTASLKTVFACLEDDGQTIRIEKPDEATQGLRNFAEAFVDVLRRI